MDYMILVGLAVAVSTTYTAYEAIRGNRHVVWLLLEAVFMIALLFFLRAAIGFWPWYLIAISVALLTGAIAVRILSASPEQETKKHPRRIFAKD